MILYLAIVEEHTFDNKWDSYSHHAIFADHKDASNWGRSEAKRLASKYGAKYLTDFPECPEKYENGFVFYSVEIHELKEKENE